MHPHGSLLDEVKIAILKLPFGFPDSQKQTLEEKYQALTANQAASEGEILAVLVGLGKASWPYRKTYETMRERYGASLQEAYFRDHLASGLSKKYEQFAGQAGRIESAIKRKEFETAFSAEEKYQIEEALFEAREQVEKDVVILIEGEHKAEYDAELTAWRGKQEQLAAKIAELRALADRSAEWAPEILDKVHVFEEGWSSVERDVDLRIVEGEIDYYRGMIH